MIYGFIGVGNMASAILRGMARSGRFPQGSLCGYNRTPAKALALQAEMGLTVCESEREAAKGADVVVRRVDADILRGVELADRPPVHNQDPVGEGEGLLLVVGHVDHGRAEALLQRFQLGPHGEARRHVQRGHRLVKEHDLRAQGQRPRDGDPLLLAAG